MTSPGTRMLPGHDHYRINYAKDPNDQANICWPCDGFVKDAVRDPRDDANHHHPCFCVAPSNMSGSTLPRAPGWEDNFATTTVEAANAYLPAATGKFVRELTGSGYIHRLPVSLPQQYCFMSAQLRDKLGYSAETQYCYRFESRINALGRHWGCKIQFWDRDTRRWHPLDTVTSLALYHPGRHCA